MSSLALSSPAAWKQTALNPIVSNQTTGHENGDESPVAFPECAANLAGPVPTRIKVRMNEPAKYFGSKATLLQRFSRNFAQRRGVDGGFGGEGDGVGHEADSIADLAVDSSESGDVLRMKCERP